MNNEIDYRLYGVTVPHPKYYYQGYTIGVFVKVYKTKKAIASNARYPNIGRVEKYISFFACLYKNNETVTLYWNGRELIDKVEYEGKLANLQKQWLKKQAAREVKATVQDVLNFVRESRRNSVNCDVKSNIKAGLTNMKAESC